MKKIRTNEICVEFDYANIKHAFDIYKIITTEKCIPGCTFLLDKPIMTLKAKSLVFEYGKSFYVLFEKDKVSVSDLRRNIIKEEKGDTLTFELISVEKMPKHLLLQLFLNSLNNPTNELLSFNNLTGKLICYRNDWMNKDKEGFIWGLDCLEIKTRNDMCLNMIAHRLSSITLKKKMPFKKRQFYEYPQYLFTDHNHTLKRADSEELNQKENFIMKPVDGERAGITYFSFENQEKFECTKLGVLYEVLSILKEEYVDYLKIDLKQYEVDKCLEYKNSDLARFKEVVKNTVASNGIVLLDGIRDETSKLYLRKLQEKLEGLIQGISVSVGKCVSEKKLNIKLIHNKTYYEGKSYDPHNDAHECAAVQHITLEDFRLNADSALANVLKELVIKKDLIEKKITMVEWQSYGYQKDWIFGIKNKGHYYFMTVYSNGTFKIECLVRNLFNMNEYDKYMDYFGDNDDTKYDYRNVVGIIKDAAGNINLIRDTNQITMPEVLMIGDTLALVAKDVKFPGAYIIDAIERMIANRIVSDKYIKELEDAKYKFTLEEEYNKIEIISNVSNQTLKKSLTKFVFEDVGELLYLFLRNQEKRDELLPGVLDINYLEIDSGEAIYNVGTVGNGMKPYIERASVVRKVEAVDGNELFFEELIPLMGVEFVRYGMLTVMPFPFKYLREYILKS